MRYYYYDSDYDVCPPERRARDERCEICGKEKIICKVCSKPVDKCCCCKGIPATGPTGPMGLRGWPAARELRPHRPQVQPEPRCYGSNRCTGAAGQQALPADRSPGPTGLRGGPTGRQGHRSQGPTGPTGPTGPEAQVRSEARQAHRSGGPIARQVPQVPKAQAIGGPTGPMPAGLRSHGPEGDWPTGPQARIRLVRPVPGPEGP